MTNCTLINVKTGLVENVIVAEPDDPVDDGYILVANYPAFVEIGTRWNDGSFIAPPVKVGAVATPITGLKTL